MVQIISGLLAEQRLYATLLAAFAVAALVLAGLGVYGMVSHSIERRRKDIGISLALGARPSDINRLVLREVLAPVLTGIAAGLLAGLGVSRAIRSLLFGTSHSDPMVYAASAVLLMGILVLECWISGRRMLDRDPLAVLRE